MEEQTAGPLKKLLDEDVYQNIQRLVRMRWLAASSLLLGTLFAVNILDLALPLWPLLILAAVIATYNSFLSLAVNGQRQDWMPGAMHRIVVLQVVLDWIAMGFVLHFSGGICSPAIPILLIHMLTMTVYFPSMSPFSFVWAGIGLLLAITLLEYAGLVPHINPYAGLAANLCRDLAYIGSVLFFFGSTALASVYLTSSVVSRLSKRERQTSALLLATQSVISTLSLDEVLERLAQSVADALQLSAASIRLLDESGELLTLTASHGLSDGYLAKGPVAVSRSKLDHDVLLGETVIIPEVGRDARVQYPREMAREGISSLLATPIVGRNRTLGVLRVYAGEVGRFSSDDAEFVQAIAKQGAVAIENALANRAMRQEQEERAEYVRLVTHQLRSPVTVGQSLLRVLRLDLTNLSDLQIDILDRLEKRLGILLELINDLLTLAASKTALLHEPLVSLALRPALERIAAGYSVQMAEKDLQLDLQCCPDDLMVMATEGGIETLVDNMITNAIKYTPSGGSIQISMNHVGPCAVISVSDNGIGIPEDELDRIWEEFGRARNVGEIPGTGLGLPIVRLLTERYGGRASVSSVEGKGATFEISLPLA